MHLLTIYFNGVELVLSQDGDKVKALIGTKYFHYKPEDNEAILQFLVATNRGLTSLIKEKQNG